METLIIQGKAYTRSRLRDAYKIWDALRGPPMTLANGKLREIEKIPVLTVPPDVTVEHAHALIEAQRGHLDNMHGVVMPAGAELSYQYVMKSDDPPGEYTASLPNPARDVGEALINSGVIQPDMIYWDGREKAAERPLKDVTPPHAHNFDTPTKTCACGLTLLDFIRVKP